MRPEQKLHAFFVKLVERADTPDALRIYAARRATELYAAQVIRFRDAIAFDKLLTEATKITAPAAVAAASAGVACH